MRTTLERYLIRLKTKRRVSDNYLRNARYTLNQFADWCEANHRTLTATAISDFVATIPHAPTANVKLSRIQHFARYMKVDLADECVRAKEEVRLIEALSSEQVRDLIKAAKSVSVELASTITFLSETGLRFQEFCDLDKSLLDEVGSGLRTIRVLGKGRKNRTVPLSVNAYEALATLPVGLTKWGQERLRKEMAQAGVAAGIRTSVHPHLLRATFISIHLNERRTESLLVAKIVGHSSVDTMMKHYYRETNERLCAAVL